MNGDEEKMAHQASKRKLIFQMKSFPSLQGLSGSMQNRITQCESADDELRVLIESDAFLGEKLKNGCTIEELKENLCDEFVEYLEKVNANGPRSRMVPRDSPENDLVDNAPALTDDLIQEKVEETLSCMQKSPTMKNLSGSGLLQKCQSAVDEWKECANQFEAFMQKAGSTGSIGIENFCVMYVESMPTAPPVAASQISCTLDAEDELDLFICLDSVECLQDTTNNMDSDVVSCQQSRSEWEHCVQTLKDKKEKDGCVLDIDPFNLCYNYVRIQNTADDLIDEAAPSKTERDSDSVVTPLQANMGAINCVDIPNFQQYQLDLYTCLDSVECLQDPTGNMDADVLSCQQSQSEWEHCGNKLTVIREKEGCSLDFDPIDICFNYLTIQKTAYELIAKTQSSNTVATDCTEHPNFQQYQLNLYTCLDSIECLQHSSGSLDSDVVSCEESVSQWEHCGEELAQFIQKTGCALEFDTIDICYNYLNIQVAANELIEGKSSTSSDPSACTGSEQIVAELHQCMDDYLIDSTGIFDLDVNSCTLAFPTWKQCAEDYQKKAKEEGCECEIDASEMCIDHSLMVDELEPEPDANVPDTFEEFEFISGSSAQAGSESDCPSGSTTDELFSCISEASCLKDLSGSFKDKVNACVQKLPQWENCIVDFKLDALADGCSPDVNVNEICSLYFATVEQSMEAISIDKDYEQSTGFSETAEVNTIIRERLQVSGIGRDEEVNEAQTGFVSTIEISTIIERKLIEAGVINKPSEPATTQYDDYSKVESLKKPKKKLYRQKIEFKDTAEDNHAFDNGGFDNDFEEFIFDIPEAARSNEEKYQNLGSKELGKKIKLRPKLNYDGRDPLANYGEGDDDDDDWNNWIFNRPSTAEATVQYLEPKFISLVESITESKFEKATIFAGTGCKPIQPQLSELAACVAKDCASDIVWKNCTSANNLPGKECTIQASSWARCTFAQGEGNVEIRPAVELIGSNFVVLDTCDRASVFKLDECLEKKKCKSIDALNDDCFIHVSTMLELGDCEIAGGVCSKLSTSAGNSPRASAILYIMMAAVTILFII
jgi:hypothetical protein